MSEPFIGEIRGFGFYFAPVDWAKCAGQTLAIAQFNAVYALLGHTFGQQSSVSFQLPNLQGRMPIGQGVGLGLTPRQIGDYGGLERHYLTQQQCPLPSHTHPATIDVSSITATSTLTVNKGTGTETAKDNGVLSEGGTGGPGQAAIFADAVGSTTATLGGVSTAIDPSGAAITVGANPGANPTQPVEFMSPFLTINFSIALRGLFPTRN